MIQISENNTSVLLTPNEADLFYEGGETLRQLILTLDLNKDHTLYQLYNKIEEINSNMYLLQSRLRTEVDNDLPF